MKPREKMFCRLLTVCADPIKAARDAGYKNPERVLPELMSDDEIAAEIRRLSENMRSIYRSTAICGLFRLACGGVGDAFELVISGGNVNKKPEELDLMCVSELKKTDKGVEVRFCDRVKALDRLFELLGDDSERERSGGLVEAMLLSAEAIGTVSAGDDSGEV